MSATGVHKRDGTTAARHTDDFYATPAWVTVAILQHLQPSRSAPRVLDPCAGGGAILAAVHATWPYATRYAIELDPGRAATCGALVVGDALASQPWPRADLIIANPPFSLAMEFLERAISEVAEGGEVAFLLRLAFLASQKRAAFHREHPSHVYVLPRRPSFTGDGKSDSADYAWFVFGADHGNRWSIL